MFLNWNQRKALWEFDLLLDFLKILGLFWDYLGDFYLSYFLYFQSIILGVLGVVVIIILLFIYKLSHCFVKYFIFFTGSDNVRDFLITRYRNFKLILKLKLITRRPCQKHANDPNHKTRSFQCSAQRTQTRLYISSPPSGQFGAIFIARNVSEKTCPSPVLQRRMPLRAATSPLSSLLSEDIQSQGLSIGAEEHDEGLAQRGWRPRAG